MKNNLAEEMIKKMPLGWALHRFVRDKDGKPCDYIFVDVNVAFEELTGLSSVDILGKKVTEVLPSILEDPFDWINSYAKVAYNDEKMEFEQYSYSLDKWYRVNAYSMEEGSFITVISEITKERKEVIDLNKMSVMSEAILQGLGEESYYQKITDHFLDITDAKFAAFNLYDVDGKQYTTMSIAGDRVNIDKAMNIIGMKLEGKKWIHDFVRAGKIKDKIVTRFPTLHDLTGDVIPKLVCDLLTKSFGLGETVVVKIAKDNIMFGDFTLIMPKDKAFDKDSIAEILTRQLGLALARAQSEESLRESEANVQKKLRMIVDPQVDISAIELSDIIDIEIMQSLMEKFYQATGLLGAVLDLSGKVVVAFGWQDICTKFHRCHPDTAKNCMESDTLLTQGVPPGTIRSYKCKNNLWDMVTPLMVGELHLGNIFFGQFFYEGETPDVALFRAQAQQYGFDEIEYLAALARVPHLNRDVAEAGLMFCAQMAGIVATLSHSAIKQTRMLTERKLVEEKIAEQNNLLEKLPEQVPGVIYQYRYHPDGRNYFPYASSAIWHVYEVTPEEVKEDASKVLSRLHPDDYNHVIEGILESSKTLENWKDEYRVILPKQGERWVSGIAKPEKLEDGSVLWHGYISDITERKHVEVEFQRFAEELEWQRNELEKRMNESVKAISKIGELRDVYTAGHQRKVAELVCAIGREMLLADKKISHLSYGGLLHDVGKFFVPSDILNKPGKVSALEYKIIQTHVEESYNVVKEIDFPKEIYTMIYQHHERLDGSGYPQGLTGDEIILESRILAVADVVEAMSSHRPYRSALGIDAALEEIELYKGTRFDTDVVDICIRLFREKKFHFNKK